MQSLRMILRTFLIGFYSHASLYTKIYGWYTLKILMAVMSEADLTCIKLCYIKREALSSVLIWSIKSFPGYCQSYFSLPATTFTLEFSHHPKCCRNIQEGQRARCKSQSMNYINLFYIFRNAWTDQKHRNKSPR